MTQSESQPRKPQEPSERQYAVSSIDAPPSSNASLTDPAVLIASAELLAILFCGYTIYRRYVRRIPNVAKIPPAALGKRSFYGKVTSVGDGDNFHFYHTPGGVFLGWGWLRAVPKVNQRGLKKETWHIRLCGVDAPERSHFGKPGQKWGDEAMEFLRSYILGRYVRVKPLSIDQYGRCVAKCWKLTWLGPRDIGAEMLRKGWAVVYEAKTGAEYDGKEVKYARLAAVAKAYRLGMWQDGVRKVMHPGEFKRRS